MKSVIKTTLKTAFILLVFLSSLITNIKIYAQEEAIVFEGLEEQTVNSIDSIELLNGVAAYYNDEQLSIDIINVTASNDDNYVFTYGDKTIDLPVDGATYEVEYSASYNDKSATAKKLFIVKFEEDSNENVLENSKVEIDSQNIDNKNSPILVSEVKAPVLRSNNNLYVSALGNDETGDGSFNNPFASINKAYDVSNNNSTIVLLSDININKLVGVFHSVTIKSQDGQGPYKVTRVSGFESSSDDARKVYQPAMFELHSDLGATTLTFENIILDDDYKHEKDSYSDQSTNGTGDNENKVQDAIIAIYEDSGKTNPATLILGNSTSVLNYGGMCAIKIVGSTSRAYMKSGSRIAYGGSSSSGISAVINTRGYFEMEEGSIIDGAKNTGDYGAAIHSDYGKIIINGNILNCSGIGNNTIVRLRGRENEIGSSARIFNNTSRIGTVYVIDGAVLNVYGQIYNNLTRSAPISGMDQARNASPVGSAIYASHHETDIHPIVNIKEDAQIYGNSAVLFIDYSIPIIGPIQFDLPSPFAASVLSNNTSSIIMDGGRISNNNTPFAVMVRKNGSFTMNGGQIDSHNYGIGVFNEGSEVKIARAIINDGVIKDNTNDVSIFASNAGYQNGSYVYSSENIIKQGIKTIDTVRDGISLSNSKVIDPDDSLKQLYLGNATASGRQRINSVVSENDGTLITTFFASNPDDVFVMDISNLSKVDDDVYVCLIPLDENGNTLNTSQQKIYLCNKTVNGSNMTVNINVNGTNNSAGYAFGIFSKRTNEKTYILHYETFGGTQIVDKTNIRFNDTNLIPSDEPKKEYANFVGWYMDEEYTKEYKNTNSYADIVDNEITKLEATLYAKYDAYKYTVVFDDNQADSGSVDSINLEYNQSFVVPDKGNLIKKHYKFVGWNTKADHSGTTYQPGISLKNLTNINNDTVILYAMWQPIPEYKITYKLNGGEYNGLKDDIVEIYEEGSIIKIHEAPTREGYRFLYWKGSEYYPGQDYIVTKDHSLVAQWKKEPSTPSYVAPKTGIE